MDEHELIKKAIKDREAFGKIVDIYYKDVFKYIYRRTLDKEITKDLTQETFLNALKYLHTYREESPILFWLFGIATNVVNLHYRKEIDERKFFEKYENIHAKNSDSLDDEIDFKFIHRYITTLPEMEQVVLTLFFFENRTFQDIALILNRSVNSIRKTYYRGLKNLKRKLENDGYKF